MNSIMNIKDQRLRHTIAWLDFSSGPLQKSSQEVQPTNTTAYGNYRRNTDHTSYGNDLSLIGRKSSSTSSTAKTSSSSGIFHPKRLTCSLQAQFIKGYTKNIVLGLLSVYFSSNALRYAKVSVQTNLASIAPNAHVLL